MQEHSPTHKCNLTTKHQQMHTGTCETHTGVCGHKCTRACQPPLSTADTECLHTHTHLETYSRYRHVTGAYPLHLQRHMCSHMSTHAYWGVGVPTPRNAPMSTGPGPRVTETHPASQHRHLLCGILRTPASPQKVAPGSHLWDSTVSQLVTKPPPVPSQGASVSTNQEAVPYLPVSPTSQPGQTPTPLFFTLSRFPGPRGETEQHPPSPHIPFTPIPLAFFPLSSRPGLLWPAEWLTPLLSQRSSDAEDHLVLYPPLPPLWERPGSQEGWGGPMSP